MTVAVLVGTFNFDDGVGYKITDIEGRVCAYTRVSDDPRFDGLTPMLTAIHLSA